MSRQQTQLALRFPGDVIKKKPGKFSADYVEHGVVTEYLISILGGFSQTIKQVITNPDGQVEGAIVTLHVHVDGEPRSIDEVGSIGQGGKKNNGDLLKDAVSDALKRCAMRLGLGLHLWSQENYHLDTTLAMDDQEFLPKPSPVPVQAPVSQRNQDDEDPFQYDRDLSEDARKVKAFVEKTQKQTQMPDDVLPNLMTALLGKDWGGDWEALVSAGIGKQFLAAAKNAKAKIDQGEEPDAAWSLTIAEYRLEKAGF